MARRNARGCEEVSGAVLAGRRNAWSYKIRAQPLLRHPLGRSRTLFSSPDSTFRPRT